MKYILCLVVIIMCIVSIAYANPKNEELVVTASKKCIPELIQQLDSPDHNVRIEAVEALVDIGAEVIPELIEALRIFGLTYVDGPPDVLIEIGPASIPALIEALDSNDKELRSSAAYILGEFGDDAKESIHSLIKIVNNDPYNTARFHAAQSLGGIGITNEEVISALIKALKDQEISVRSGAASSLGDFGSAAKTAVPALIESMIYEGEHEEAAKALGKIGPAAKDAVPVLILALMDKNQGVSVRREAATALGGIGKEAIASVDPLVKIVTDAREDWSLRSCAMSSLVKIAPENPNVLSALIYILKSKRGPNDFISLKENTPELFGQIGKKVVPDLVKALDDEKKWTRYFAAQSLAKIGTEAEESVYILKQIMLKESDRDVRRAITEAIHQIEKSK